MLFLLFILEQKCCHWNFKRVRLVVEGSMSQLLIPCKFYFSFSRDPLINVMILVLLDQQYLASNSATGVESLFVYNNKIDTSEHHSLTRVFIFCEFTIASIEQSSSSQCFYTSRCLYLLESYHHQQLFLTSHDNHHDNLRFQ